MLLSAIFVILLVLFFIYIKKPNLRRAVNIISDFPPLPSTALHVEGSLKVVCFENTGDEKKLWTNWSVLKQFETL